MDEAKDHRLPSVRITGVELRRLMRASQLIKKPTSELIRRAVEKELAQIAKRHPELKAA